MIYCQFENGGLIGKLSFERNSYIVRIYRTTDISDRFAEPMYYMSFGNGVMAEDRLLALLEHPAWTILKYGK